MLTDPWLVTLVERRVVSGEVLAGYEILGVEGRENLYLTLHCHHQNDSCMGNGAAVSQLNVSLIVGGTVTKTVSINHNFWRERRTEEESNEVVLLTGLAPYR